MTPLVYYVLAGFALFGHVAICVASINRLHSIGLGCRALRAVNTLWYLFFFGVPLSVASWYTMSTVTGRAPPLVGPAAFLFVSYTAISAIAAMITSVCIVTRFHHAPTTERLITNHTNRVDMIRQLGGRPVGDFVTGLASRIPGNEILQLSIHEKTLVLPRLADALDGLTMVHLSDLHLTGQLTIPFFQEVIRQTNALEPDLVAITGDIIDKRQCLSWIPEILGPLTCRGGVFYVLGNHDQRVRDDNAVQEALDDAGLIGVGGCWHAVEVRSHPIILAGNALPWYAPAADLGGCPTTHPSGRPLRVALSHSPDQFDWARHHDFDLMLAGHTHGGQIRLPIIGPVLSPSWHGVRYASGTFYKPPTVMHVSRGISGTRPIRLNCPPELARLVLRKHPVSET